MKKYISLLLAALMLLSCGCAAAEEEEAYVPTGNALLMEGQDPEDIMPTEEPVQSLTLAYDPTRSMNPLIGYDLDNRTLFSLMYQSLFATDSKGTSWPILCSGYDVTPDNQIWTFYVDPAATFSDGSYLSADDVYASYQAAQKSDYKAGDNGGVYTLLRAYAGGQSQCNGQGQCNDGYNDTGDDVADQIIFAVAFQCVENNGSDFVVHFNISPKTFLYLYSK